MIITNIKNDSGDKNRNLKIIKALYVFFVVLVTAALVFELYFVIDRRMSVDRINKYKIGKGNIYSARFITEAFSESLWEIKWEKYRANALLEKTVDGVKYVVQTNSHGFRTKEFTTIKPAGVYRIICIGGSTTVQGITNEMTYPEILEKLLKKRYPHLQIEVLNFGIGRTESNYWADRLEDLFRMQPDMIIQYNAVNDISWRYFPRHNNTCTNKMKHIFLKAVNYSYVLQRLFPLDTSFFDKCIEQSLDNFNKIATEARSRGVEYIVGSFAAPDYYKATDIFRQYLDYNVQSSWGTGINLKYYLPYHKTLTRFNRFLRSYAEDNNITLAHINESMTDPELFIDICHITPAGIEKMAELFAETLHETITEESRVKITNN